MTHPAAATPAAHVAASGALRRLALDEDLKRRVMSDPALAAVARRVAARYVAGERLEDAVRRAHEIVTRGHAVSLEFVGENVRDASVAAEATEEFLAVAQQIRLTGLPGTVCLDLSHIGLLVDPELARDNAARIARAAGEAGSVLVISAEASDRTDLVLDTYERLAATSPDVSVTLQARLHRTPEDLERVMRHRGRVRLVKGAYEEPEHAALPRESPELRETYLRLAGRLIEAGHPVSIATHDQLLLDELKGRHGDALRRDAVEFEMLLGLGGDGLDRLRAEGHRTREYVVYGGEWWLYALNRISEDPVRLHTALTDAVDRS